MAGFWVGDAEDLLAPNDHERKLLDFRSRVVRAVRAVRERSGLTQGELAEAIGSAQDQIARIEGPGVGVALDLMLSALFAAGGSLDDLPPAHDPIGPTHLMERVEPPKVSGVIRARS